MMPEPPESNATEPRQLDSSTATATAMSSTGGGWAQLRQQARALEQQTETQFHTYSQFASAPNIPQKPSEDELRTESSLQELLEKREALVGQLSRLLDSEASSSAVKLNNLARHREILSDHRRELSRIKSTIADARNRANLLSNVRDDIDQYRSANPEADYMLDERSRIDNSHNVADSVLSQAYAVNENFRVQRETLASVQRRIVGAASQVPGLNSLMARIGSKKRRDGIILGSFIAFCFLMLLWFW
jgi:Golgi SNAP receptor complex protein 1